MNLLKRNLSFELIYRAYDVTKNSYSPYSNYKVGASVLLDNGKIYTGTNIENASYSHAICAERSAIYAAISESGEKNIMAVAIATTSSKDFPYPCGACRQVINEFAKTNIPIYLINKNMDIKITDRDTLFPHGFTKTHLNNI